MTDDAPSRPRLLVVVDKFLPDRGGGAAVYSEMCFELASRGFDVSVFSPVPFYPEWKDKASRNGLRFWRYRENNVDVTRYGIFIPRKARSLVQRLTMELSIVLSLLRLLPRARHADVVMVYCPWFGLLVFASLVRAIFRKPLWLNVQDVPTDAAAATGLLRSPFLTRVSKALERFFYNRADVWSSISSVMIDKLKPMRMRRQPIMFLPNWADGLFLAEVARNRREVRPKGSVPRLLYAGNIGGKQDLIAFCRYLCGTDARFEFRIFGNGGAADELAAWVKSAHDERFSIGPFLGAGDLARQLAWTDLHVITERQGSGNSFFPSKLVTAMASGTPSLAICEPSSPLGMEMRSASPGVAFEWDELDKLPAFLKQVSATPELLEDWRANAVVRARFYNRDLIIGRLAGLLKQMARGTAMRMDPALGDVAESAAGSKPGN